VNNSPGTSEVVTWEEFSHQSRVIAYVWRDALTDKHKIP